MTPREMLGLTDDDEEEGSRKDLGKARRQRDEGDVAKLVAQFASFQVFSRESTRLVCLTTGDVPKESIVHDLQKEKIVTERLVEKKTSLHAPIPKKLLHNLASMYAVVETSRNKRQKSSRLTLICSDASL